jgi:hypothetical protein
MSERPLALPCGGIAAIVLVILVLGGAVVFEMIR